jgi:hypothetical protein
MMSSMLKRLSCIIYLQFTSGETFMHEEREQKINLSYLCFIVVGTLNHGYPLLQYKDTVPARLSLVSR